MIRFGKYVTNATSSTPFRCFSPVATQLPAFRLVDVVHNGQVVRVESPLRLHRAGIALGLRRSRRSSRGFQCTFVNELTDFFYGTGEECMVPL